MVCFEVGYKSDDIWSINMVECDSIDSVEAAISVTRYAASKARKYNYDDYFVSHSPLAVWQISERKAKGMPLVTIPV